MLMQIKMSNYPLNFQPALVSRPMTRDSTTPKKMTEKDFIPSPTGFVKEENKPDLHTIPVVSPNVTLPQIQLPKIATLEDPAFESRTGSITDLSGRRNSVNIGALCDDVPNTTGPHIPRPVTMNNMIPPYLPKLNTYQLRTQLPEAQSNYYLNSTQYTPASHASFEPAYTTSSTFANPPVASYFPSNSTPTTRKNSSTMNCLPEERRRVSVSLTEQAFNEGERYNNDGQLIGKTGKPLRNTKRAAQNRSAQKAFRQRREKYIKNLEEKSKVFDRLVKENNELKKKIESLQSKLNK
ncbi:cin5p [Saccharomyces arboricola H-6]|uniref:Cin5p n=1 Tax=Saccharomyces arboricola (strain H-6 / AS 2.3317 / CBS 10644) TaxID=1160507 RepID=J8PWK5_SACAR|nr:cin5p [Saccharomyces arboricola H-6]